MDILLSASLIGVFAGCTRSLVGNAMPHSSCARGGGLGREWLSFHLN